MMASMEATPPSINLLQPVYSDPSHGHSQLGQEGVAGSSGESPSSIPLLSESALNRPGYNDLEQADRAGLAGYSRL